METASERRPWFSIGVTAFKRPDLLTVAIASIRGQTFENFEIIVGNDNPDAPLSLADLGASDDARIRIINHPQNLGEMRNMNALLAAARGRYFTWLADDDAYAPEFLTEVHRTLVAHEVPCVFTSYSRDSQAGLGATVAAAPRVLNGEEFVSRFLDRTLLALGCYGVFETERLRGLGGMEQLGKGFSPYSDTLLAIRAARLGRIGYIDAPLLLFRAHEGSQSSASNDLAAYHTAQRDFCDKSLPILRETAHSAATFQANWYELLTHHCVHYYCAVALRGGHVTIASAWRYARLMAGYGGLLGERRQAFSSHLRRSIASLVLHAQVRRVRRGLRAVRQWAAARRLLMSTR